MSKSFKKLDRILKLEASQGYENKAVVGGIRQLVAFWVTQAREEAVDEADLAFVEQTAEVLTGYDKLPGKEKRAEVVDTLLEKLGTRGKRVALMAPAVKVPDSRERESKARSRTASTPPPKPQKPVIKPKKSPQLKPSPPPKPKKKEKEMPPQKRKVRKNPWLKIVPAEPDAHVWQIPINELRGVGPKMSEKLAKLGIQTVGDMFLALPRRYDDYTLMKPINRLQFDEQVTIIGTVWETRARRTRSGEMVQATISDGTGRIQATWFNQPWLAQKLPAGLQIVISGKVDRYLGRPVFNSPQWEPLQMEPLKTRRIVPIYALTEGLKSYKMREIARQTVEQFSSRVIDPMPASIVKKNNFYPLLKAIQQVHFPDEQESLRQAHRRLVFDELFLLQMGMLGQRHEWQKNAGIPLPFNATVLERFLLSLPFELTKAQRRVISEISQDMTQNTPMNRLLQGDVGAGKTVVAAAAMAIAVKAKTQATLMAPTAILAEQHYQGLSKLFANEEFNIQLLTGGTPAVAKADILQKLAAGEIDILIGTHTLIQEPVRFKQLTLAVIDEQHRFGVDQRQALRDKGARENGSTRPLTPHLLIMSATPIPRTLALSIYGDLDVSIIDELPPGRQEIKTRWLRPSERERAYAFVRNQINAGRQAFIICPLVEESEKIEAVSAVEEHARLQEKVFPDLKLGLVHGRLKNQEKEAVMNDFYENKINILVSTSVIEVGIDVPNSTIMLIEGANRFGLAQLHQFRGRVGRGEHQSYCLLISDSSSTDAEQRLQALEATNDGFILAEKDLELRGPGQFFGRSQSGLPEIRMAALLDQTALDLARKEAQALFSLDPLLEQKEHKHLQARVAQFWADAGDAS